MELDKLVFIQKEGTRRTKIIVILGATQAIEKFDTALEHISYV